LKKISFFASLLLIAGNISCNNAPTETNDGSVENATNTNTTVNGNAPEAPEGLSLMTKSDCMTCHNATTKVVGPSFADIAAKYANTTDNIAKLDNAVINGGAGTWGSIPMPGHAGLSKQEAEKMVTYILSVKK
jgi:cytochrome c